MRSSIGMALASSGPCLPDTRGCFMPRRIRDVAGSVLVLLVLFFDLIYRETSRIGDWSFHQYLFFLGTGIILNAVRPERAVDFELVIGYLQAAFEKSASPQVRTQAAGWRMFKATEPGPNNTVLYVFLLDPTVVGAEYALGPILSDAYPDQVEQIWKLYQGALAGAGSQSLLNLTPVMPPPLPPAGAPVPPPAGTPPPATTFPGAAPTTSPAPRPPAVP